MGLSESDTRAKLIDPALHARGWTEDLIRREETAGAIELDPSSGTARKQPRGRIDYTLRFRVNPGTQPVALALIEAKAEQLAPDHGLEQVKVYGATRGRLRSSSASSRPKAKRSRTPWRAYEKCWARARSNARTSLVRVRSVI